MSIKWTAPTKLNGISGALTDNADFGINNYKVFYGMKSDAATTAASTYPKNPDATTKVLPAVFTQDVSGLKRGTYYYAVKASTIAGDSVYSDTSDAITSAMAPTAPTAVIPYPEFIQTADNLKIKWTKPSSDNGSAITKYIIYYSINTPAAATLKAGEATPTTNADKIENFAFNVKDEAGKNVFPQGVYYF